MLLVVLAIDLMLFFGGYAVADINPDSDFYSYGDTVLQRADAGDGSFEVRSLNSSDLPGSTASVDPETGSFFTDLFRSARNWLLSNVPGAQTVYMVVNAVPNFLSAIGLPQVFVFGVGALWHMLGAFLLVSFLWGRE